MLGVRFYPVLSFVLPSPVLQDIDCTPPTCISNLDEARPLMSVGRQPGIYAMSALLRNVRRQESHDELQFLAFP